MPENLNHESGYHPTMFPCNRSSVNDEPLPIFESSNKQSVPKRIHLAPPCVHHLAEIFVDLGRAEGVPILGCKLFDHKFVQHRLNILEIGHVPTRTDNRMCSNGIETLDIFEARERTI